MEYVFVCGVALLVGYLAGRQGARSQVFDQIAVVPFLSATQREQLRSYLIAKSGAK